MFEEFLPRKKIGYLFPLTVVDNMAYQFYKTMPDDVMLVALPVGVRAFDPKDVERAFGPIDEYTSFLLKQEVDIIVQGGVPPAIVMGVERHDALLARIASVSGLPATSTTLNVVAAARSLGIRNIACANKWSPEMNRVLASFFGREGIRVAGVSSKSMAPQEFLQMRGGEGLHLAYDLGRAALIENPDADGVYIGGGAWLTFGLFVAPWLCMPYLGVSGREFRRPLRRVGRIES